jgi:L-ascorbate metabolism protein UlaG (beta-lactamase superfamily)
MKRKSNAQVSLDDFLRQGEDGVFYVGHASIVVRINGYNFLFDFVRDGAPYGDKWKFFPALIQSIPMKKIHGIFVSHIHQDHFDQKFLSSDEISCPVYIIEGRPAFEIALSHLGIYYTRLQAGKKIQIASDVYVYGIHHQSNGIDASCCIGNDNFSLYHGNDNYLENELLYRLKAAFPVIDVACIPYAYINWYPQLLDNLSKTEKSSESYRLCNFYFEYAITQAKVLNAKQVIPFGANLVYADDAYSPLNLECKT